ncbi:unannotated protein [freshwater metagenome]|uniref:Unannotated protein n=1 Tax=freshwater metagenome TaxID=449393 RepID=A0A6J6BUT2_9ZZZZ
MRPGSSKPIACNNSSASASSSSESSASVLASKKIASAGAIMACNLARSAWSFISEASTLKTYKNGFAVSKCNSAIASRSTLEPKRSLPEFNNSCASLAAANVGAFSLEMRASFSRRVSAFSIVCKSASASSVLMTSISEAGSTKSEVRSPSRVTFSSLNTRMT